MIVTEAEASTKRCQESFGDSAVNPTGYSYPSTQTFSAHMGAGTYVAMSASPSMCIGSACMAWRARWRLLDADGKPFTEANYIYPPHDLAEGYTVQAVGYCGKAGRP